MMHGGIRAIAEAPQERAAQSGLVLRRLIAYLQPFWKQLLYILVLVVISAAAQAAGPHLIGRAIDGAIGQGDRAGLNRIMI